MRFDNYLIVSDLDGTLFNREQKVPEISLNALKYFKENGGIFTFATGRDIMFIKRRFAFLIDLINAPAIMSNGAMLYDFSSEECLFSKTLKRNSAIEILKRVNENFPDAPFEISSTDGYIVVNPDDNFLKRFTNMRDIVTFSDKLIIPDGEFVRVNFIDRNIDRIQQVSKLVNELDIKDEFEKVFSDKFIFELLPQNATKGNALKKLCGMFHDNKTVIAAGDWDNDFSLLKASDIPVCPQNAACEIKKFCKFVLCDCDTGIINDIVQNIERGYFDIILGG